MKKTTAQVKISKLRKRIRIVKGGTSTSKTLGASVVSLWQSGLSNDQSASQTSIGDSVETLLQLFPVRVHVEGHSKVNAVVLTFWQVPEPI